MDIVITLIVCIAAGAGAGVCIGFAGVSATTVLAPVLFNFLGVPAYQAVAIGLASDVLASGVSAYTYYKNKNTDIKNSMLLTAFVLLFTVIGSFIASFFSNTTMGNASLLLTIAVGLIFLLIPNKDKKKSPADISKIKRIVICVDAGCVLGLWCGIMGVGGGMLFVLLLTVLLNYDLKTAVGTSVFIMSIVALTGSVSHFIIGGIPDILILSVSVVSTFVFARIASVFANKSNPKTLRTAVGISLISLCGIVMVFNLLF